MVVTGEQSKYRNRNEALDRAATIVSHHTNDSIQVIKVIEQKNGMDLTQTNINREKFNQLSDERQLGTTTSDSFSYSEPEANFGHRVATTQQRWDYNIDPVLQQSIGAPEAFYLYSLGLSAKSNYWLSDNLELGGGLYINMVDNYDKFNYIKNSHMFVTTQPRE